MTFDLLSQPWLPCRRQDGSRTELGLTALFEQAHEIESLDDPSPLVTLALHRLLLAVLHRTVGPPSLRAWKELYGTGRMPIDRINEYLKEHAAAFDLLHPKRPFYQTRGLPAEYKPDGVGRLVFERSNYGNAALVFQHRPTSFNASDALPLAEAARQLVALHAFAPRGLIRKAGEPDSASAAPLNHGAFVLIRGPSLFDTLLFNLVVYDPENSKPFSGDPALDRPSWEQPAQARPGPKLESKRQVLGYLDWLTWQSRRVELELTADKQRVRGIVYCVGIGVQMPSPRDPMLAYFESKKDGVFPMGLSNARALWRDCHAFLRETNGDGAAPPQVVAQLRSRDLASAVQEKRPSLVVLGMLGKDAAIKLTRVEQLKVPTSILISPDLQAQVLLASQAAERIGSALNSAMGEAAYNILSPGLLPPDPKAVRKLSDSLGGEARYWATLSTVFNELLDRLSAGEGEALAQFESAATRAATAALYWSCSRSGLGSRQMKALALAETHFRKTAATAAERTPL